MLVLTRKADEQILIGDDIKITLVRVRGNSVRIGIDAPRDIRVVRGELERFDSSTDEEFVLSDREGAFAHPPASVAVAEKKKLPEGGRLMGQDVRDRNDSMTGPQIFVGRVRENGETVKLTRAPLARFVSAT